MCPSVPNVFMRVKCVCVVLFAFLYLLFTLIVWQIFLSWQLNKTFLWNVHLKVLLISRMSAQNKERVESNNKMSNRKSINVTTLLSQYLRVDTLVCVHMFMRWECSVFITVHACFSVIYLTSFADLCHLFTSSLSDWFIERVIRPNTSLNTVYHIYTLMYVSVV